MNKHFMIDIETSGVDREKDVVLEIAMLEVDYDGVRWNAGRKFRQSYPSDLKPTTVFQKEHQQGLFAECNALYLTHDVSRKKSVLALWAQPANGPLPPPPVRYRSSKPPRHRNELRGFFALCDETIRVTLAPLELEHEPFTCIPDPLVYLMGWNISGFDVPFLVHHRFLRPSSYTDVDGKQVQHGDFHYRHYELGGAAAFARDVLNVDIETTAKRDAFFAWAKCFDQDTVLPPGAKHGALYDCYAQLKLLNGLLHVARNAVPYTP